MIKIREKSLTSLPKIRPTRPHMKYPTLQKVTLTAMALVAALAISSRASAQSLSSARQTHGSAKSVNPIHRLLFPASTYQIDDGSAEDAIGLTAGGDTICLNEFAVIPGSENISSVSIAWGTPAFFDPTLDGLPYTVAIWSDPNGDGDPGDAVLLTTASGVVSDQGTDTFITTSLSASISTSNFFVGFLITQGAGQFPAAFDESSPINNRSYIAGGASGNINNLNDNDLPVAPIESFGLFGNWLIRADAGTGTNITLSAKVRRQGGNRFVVLNWSPADGGQVNVLRNGSVIGTTTDDGDFQKNIHQHTGTDTYQVCTTDTNSCSNTVTVTTH
jgi:hypothetical protein